MSLCISDYLSICLSVYLSIYLAMESSKTTKSFEEQSFCFDSEFDSAKKAGGGTSLVALLGIVEEPGLVVQLLLSQISAIKKAVNSQLTVMFLLFEALIMNEGSFTFIFGHSGQIFEIKGKIVVIVFKNNLQEYDKPNSYNESHLTSHKRPSPHLSNLT